MTDVWSKYVECDIIESKSADIVVQSFFQKWICRHGACNTLLTDNGKEYTNSLMSELSNRFCIDHITIVPRRPQQNPSERWNRTFAKYLRVILDNNTIDWEKWIPPLLLSYNTAVHKSTLETPFFLTYFHPPRLPFDLDQPQ